MQTVLRKTPGRPAGVEPLMLFVSFLLCWLLYLLLLFSFFYPTQTNAEDWHQFETMANQTIKAVKKGHPKDLEELIRLQEHLMEIGIRACQSYAQAHPQDAKMFQLVVANAEDMKFLSLSEIKQQWHSKQFLMSHGISAEKLHQNSVTGSLLDSVVHPATAYIALREYRRTRDAALLMQVHHELAEAVIQLSYLQHTGAAK